jgi:hypothetical protein
MSALASEKKVAAAIEQDHDHDHDQDDEPVKFVESETHETLMAYDPASKMPVLVTLVWSCALIGFGLYLAYYLFPDLAAWGKP